MADYFILFLFFRFSAVFLLTFAHFRTLKIALLNTHFKSAGEYA